MMHFRIALLAVLLAMAVNADIKAKPLLIVHKKVSEANVVVGGELNVTITVTNIGQSPAFDIQVVDVSPIDGEKTLSIARLAFNEAESFSYIISPKQLGELSLPQAEVTYLAQEGDTNRQSALSNIPLEDETPDAPDAEGPKGVMVVTATEYQRLHTRHIKEIITYIFLCAGPILFPFYMHRSKQSQTDHLLREARKK